MAAFTRALARIETSVIPSMPKVVRDSWFHEAGLKTVHFWAPAFKWGLVIAGFADSISRPPERLSVGQCGSLAATGVIWSRYSMVITPKNYLLLSVNLCVAATNIYQLARIYKYRQSVTETV